MEKKKVIMTELLKFKTCEFRGFSCQFRKLTEVGVVKGVVKRSEA